MWISNYKTEQIDWNVYEWKFGLLQLKMIIKNIHHFLCRCGAVRKFSPEQFMCINYYNELFCWMFRWSISMNWQKSILVEMSLGESNFKGVMQQWVITLSCISVNLLLHRMIMDTQAPFQWPFWESLHWCSIVLALPENDNKTVEFKFVQTQ